MPASSKYRARGVVLAVVAVVAVVAALLVAGGASARPMRCAAVIDDVTADQAAAELRLFASQLQGEEIADAPMGHVMQLLDLAEQLDQAPRMGCELEVW